METNLKDQLAQAAKDIFVEHHKKTNIPILHSQKKNTHAGVKLSAKAPPKISNNSSKQESLTQTIHQIEEIHERIEKNICKAQSMLDSMD